MSKLAIWSASAATAILLLIVAFAATSAPAHWPHTGKVVRGNCEVTMHQPEWRRHDQGTLKAWGKAYIHGGCGNNRVMIGLARRFENGWQEIGPAGSYVGSSRIMGNSLVHFIDCNANGRTMATVVSISDRTTPADTSHRADETMTAVC